MNKHILYSAILTILIPGVCQALPTGSNVWFWNWPGNIQTWWNYSEPSSLESRTQYIQNENKLNRTQQTVEHFEKQGQSLIQEADEARKKLAEDMHEYTVRCASIKKDNPKADCSAQALKLANGWYQFLITHARQQELTIEELSQYRSQRTKLAALKEDFEKRMPKGSVPKINCPLEPTIQTRLMGSLSTLTTKIRNSLPHTTHTLIPQKNTRVPLFATTRYTPIATWKQYMHKPPRNIGIR